MWIWPIFSILFDFISLLPSALSNYPVEKHSMTPRLKLQWFGINVHITIFFQQWPIFLIKLPFISFYAGSGVLENAYVSHTGTRTRLEDLSKPVRSKKTLHTKMKEKRPRERSRTRWIHQIKKDLEMSEGEIREKIQENQEVEE